VPAALGLDSFGEEVGMPDVIEVLTAEGEEIVDNAAAALERSNLPHYAAVGAATARDRLAQLLALVVSSVETRDLVAMIDYARRIARERFDAGFDIREVQTAFNVLEEAVWARVVDAIAPRDLAEAIGMVTTVIGAGRDALASEYVSLASKQRVPTLDLSALFRGVG
jgi:hypothetical protein